MNNAVTRNTLFTPFHLQGGFKAYFRCNYSNLFIESSICIIKSQQSTDMLEERLQSALDMWGKNSSYAQAYCAPLMPQEGYFTKELHSWKNLPIVVALLSEIRLQNVKNLCTARSSVVLFWVFFLEFLMKLRLCHQRTMCQQVRSFHFKYQCKQTLHESVF